MVRMQVQFGEQQLCRLREQAAAEHASVSEIVRRAVDAWMEGRGQPTPAELRRRAIGAAGTFASGRSDVAEQHDDYLADAFQS
jgi:Arc/MetJ-type ribon-helix-helix transcriptional regulator